MWEKVLRIGKNSLYTYIHPFICMSLHPLPQNALAEPQTLLGGPQISMAGPMTPLAHLRPLWLALRLLWLPLRPLQLALRPLWLALRLHWLDCKPLQPQSPLAGPEMEGRMDGWTDILTPVDAMK